MELFKRLLVEEEGQGLVEYVEQPDNSSSNRTAPIASFLFRFKFSRPFRLNYP